MLMRWHTTGTGEYSINTAVIERNVTCLYVHTHSFAHANTLQACDGLRNKYGADGWQTTCITCLEKSASTLLPLFFTLHKLVWIPKFKGTAMEPLVPHLFSLSLSSPLMNGALRVDFNYCSVEVGIGHALNWNETHFSPQQGREENGG